MTETSRINELNDDRAPVCQGGSRSEFAHALLFTGHMIDRADRLQPVFPPHAERRVRDAILQLLGGITWTHPGRTIGLAGAANGGDILFHECCEQLEIPTRVLLALPPEEFEETSVAPAGPGWVHRFRALLCKAGPAIQVMQDNDGLWEGTTSSPWQRANLWMIGEAIRIAPEQAVVALWNGGAGEGPGGTEHFLQLAVKSGIRVLPPIQIQAL